MRVLAGLRRPLRSYVGLARPLPLGSARRIVLANLGPVNILEDKVSVQHAVVVVVAGQHAPYDASP
jgi:hypothetical protein